MGWVLGGDGAAVSSFAGAVDGVDVVWASAKAAIATPNRAAGISVFPRMLPPHSEKLWEWSVERTITEDVSGWELLRSMKVATRILT